MTEPTTLAAALDGAAFLLLTVPEASAATGLSEVNLRNLIARRRIPVVRLGRAVRIRLSDLNEWINAQTEPARFPVTNR